MESPQQEDVLSKLFKDSVFSPNYVLNTNENIEYQNYLTELSSFGINKLACEPAHISDSIENIREETQNLAFRNYKTFIQTAECSSNILQDFKIVEKHVDITIDSIPNLIESCKKFSCEAKNISLSRKANAVTLSRHTQLLEVLEIPQLMETCARNGYYEEALDLSAYVQRLERRQLNIPIIENIIEDVKRSCSNMLSKLLGQLSGDLQLPACLRVIGYLRRLELFDHTELRIKFLQARDCWLDNLLKAIPTQDSYHHLIKLIEVTRVHLFDVLTQYNAVFPDSHLDDRSEPLKRGVYYSWITLKISNFLSSLNDCLYNDFETLPGRLDSICSQCLYFGLSFSRVGVDFRPALHGVFERYAIDAYARSLTAANERFLEDLNSISSMVSVQVKSHSNKEDNKSGPPMSLLDHNSLAIFCNAFIEACLDLRKVTPCSIEATIRKESQNVLDEMSKAIQERDKLDKSSRNQKEQLHFERFTTSFNEDLLPFVLSCMDAIFTDN